VVFRALDGAYSVTSIEEQGGQAGSAEEQAETPEHQRATIREGT